MCIYSPYPKYGALVVKPPPPPPSPPSLLFSTSQDIIHKIQDTQLQDTQDTRHTAIGYTRYNIHRYRGHINFFLFDTGNTVTAPNFYIKKFICPPREGYATGATHLRPAQVNLVPFRCKNGPS